MINYKELMGRLKNKLSLCMSEQVILSYPVPKKMAGISVDAFFLYYSGRQMTRRRPFGYLVADSDTGEILLYQNCRIRDFMDTEKYPLLGNISYKIPDGITIKQLCDVQAQLGQLYDQLHGDQPENREAFQKYWELLRENIPQDLIPYYQSLAEMEDAAPAEK